MMGTTRTELSRTGVVHAAGGVASLEAMGESWSVSRTVLVELLAGQLKQWQHDTGRSAARIVDLGGGTGGLAVALADYGHDVSVVDPSPNALAALQRRAAEHQLADRINGVQGDAASLVQLFGAGSLDVVTCHNVLEIIESPAEALQQITKALTPGGAFSLLVAQRYPAMMTRALAGDLDDAREIWQDVTRFDPDRIQQLVRDAGLHIESVHGIGAVSAAVSEDGLSSADVATLRDLERAVSTQQSLWAAAPNLHIFGTRPAD